MSLKELKKQRCAQDKLKEGDQIEFTCERLFSHVPRVRGIVKSKLVIVATDTWLKDLELPLESAVNIKKML